MKYALETFSAVDAHMTDVDSSKVAETKLEKPVAGEIDTLSSEGPSDRQCGLREPDFPYQEDWGQRP